VTSDAQPQPCSNGQRRLWFADQIGENGLEFVYPYALRLRGLLDDADLQEALDVVVARHGSLRTTYALVDGEPHQRVHDGMLIPIDFRRSPSLRISGHALPAAVQPDIEGTFDLTTGPLLRVIVHHLTDDDHLMIVVAHHIATDGQSMDVFFRELAEAYNARRAGRPARLPALTMQYVDFARWERETADPALVATQLGYWRDTLAGAPLTVDLPTDRRRPAAQSYRGAVVTFNIPAEAIRRLDEVTRRAGASRFMGILAGLQATLGRWSRVNDLIIGTPLARRPLAGTEKLIGFFVNLLPFRLRTDERLSFYETLTRTRDVTLDAYDNQAVTFDQITNEVAPARTLAHNPVVQVTLTDETSVLPDFAGLDVEALDARLDITRYDLAFDYRPLPGGGLTFDLYYAVDLYDRATIERLAGAFEHDLRTLLAAADRPMCTIPLVDEVPAGPAALGPAALLPAGISRTAAADPGRLAVVAGDSQLSFAELDGAVSRLAGWLRARGVGSGDLVAICLPREVSLLVALAAVWRAGAALLPLDPAYPAARLEHMLSDGGVHTVLTWADAPVTWPAHVTTIDVAETAPDDDISGPWPVVNTDDLAYVIYTSGSTGRPKGVAVSHGAVASLVRGLEQIGAYRLDKAVVAWNASASFDASVQQWARVYRGDSIVLLTDEQRREPEEIAQAIARHGVTDLDVTPSHLEVLTAVLPAAVSGRPIDRRLRLLVGGEAISPALWSTLRDWHNRGIASALNVYGPTENTVDSLAAWIHDFESPHIGTPLPGVAAYVVDQYGRPVPDGIDGELMLTGAQLAQGYRNNPEETTARFVPDTVSGSGRMYRTGDLARRVAGALQFRGRLDSQVKVRGYRIELGEIDAVLAAVPGVTGAAATVTQDGETIAAVFTTSTGVSAPTVLARAAEFLPAFMVPSVLRAVEAIPRTGSGKVDRPAIAESLGRDATPVAATGAGAQLDGPIERLIADVWSEVLRLDSVGPYDNFFTLGGHSLLAIRLVARVKQQLSLKVPISAVFRHTTLRELAAHIAGLMRAELAGRAS
jgi:amino acid adenylation domain-containing protein